eukprot:1156647-Pelagomonas_calceolata.AAC.5
MPFCQCLKQCVWDVAQQLVNQEAEQDRGQAKSTLDDDAIHDYCECFRLCLGCDSTAGQSGSLSRSVDTQTAIFK